MGGGKKKKKSTKKVHYKKKKKKKKVSPIHLHSKKSETWNSRKIRSPRVPRGRGKKEFQSLMEGEF